MNFDQWVSDYHNDLGKDCKGQMRDAYEAGRESEREECAKLIVATSHLFRHNEGVATLIADALMAEAWRLRARK